MKADREYILDVARTLIRINTENPPGRELEAAGYLADELARLGMKTRIDRFEDTRANVVAEAEGGPGPTLLINTHLDTVPAGERELWTVPPFEGEVREGRIYGRGSVDAKGVAASVLGALKTLAEEGWPIRGRVVFAAVSDEEVEGKGTKRLIRAGLRADYAVVGEPTSLEVCTAHKGRLVLEVGVTGRSAHASVPWRGSNAIVHAARLIERIDKVGFRKRSRLLGRPTCSVTLIRGGVKDNIIPDRCVFTLDVRTLPSMSLDEVVRTIERRLGRSLPGGSYSLRIVNYVPPAETPAGSRLVKAGLESVNEVLKRRGRARGFRATCDMSFLVNVAGIPTIILGPGDIDEAHKVDESVKIEDLTNASLVYRRLIGRLLS